MSDFPKRLIDRKIVAWPGFSRALLLAFALLLSHAAQALTATASPTACASIAGVGTVVWINPARAVSSNNSYATASVDGTTTRYLRCTGYNFAIPVGATINGIIVNVERRSNRITDGGSRDAAMRLVKGGVIGATDRSSATLYTTVDVVVAHGGAADLWGTTWTAAEVNAANFGAAFAATKASAAGPAHTVSVDHLQITVDYTYAPGVYSVTASPTACASIAGIGTVAWINPARAVSSNNSYVTASVDGTITRYLRCLGYNFAIPAGATINGIVVNVERRSNRITDGGSRDAAMRLVKGGVIGATDRSSATLYTTADVVVAHGTAADLWGTTWTVAQINAANFGAAFAATKASAAGPAHTVSVDHMPITVNFTVAPVGPDHYELSLPTASVACLASPVTVTACADNISPCVNKYAAASGTNATLATSAGALGATTVTFDATGVATTTLAYPAAVDGVPATVTLSAEATLATNLRKCCQNGVCVVANSCATTFNTAGFIFSASADGAAATIPTQTAGTVSSTYYLRAVKTSTITKACEAALSAPSAVNLGYTCNNPAACDVSNRLDITPYNGAAAQATQTVAPASSAVSLYFDANGNAPFTFNYRDVGQLTINASKAAGGSLLTALAGSSNAFVSKPGGFVISAIQRTALPLLLNPAAPDALGGLFVKAGEDFSATVTATTSGGAVTPNFGKESSPEGVLLTSALLLPAAGAPGGLANAAIPGGSFSSGVATVSNLSWSEVGIISLTPSVGDGSYLGAGDVTGTTTGNIGRFYPDHFETTLIQGCDNVFTYSGQPFSLQIAAYRAGGSGAVGMTTNYDGVLGFAKATTVSGIGAAGAITGGSVLPAQFTSGSTPALGAALVLRPTFTFAIAPTVVSNLTLRAVDSDLVSSNGALEGVTSVRSGRARLSSAYGSELLDLPVIFRTEFWNGTGWVLNAADTCTGDAGLDAGNAVTVALVSAPLGLPTCVRDAGSPGLSGAGCAAAAPAARAFREGVSAAFAGDFNLWLQAPGVAGSTTMTATVPAWLGVLAPTRATFGVYKTPLIYRRENF